MALEVPISTREAVIASKRLARELKDLGASTEQAERRVKQLEDRLRKRLAADKAERAVNELRKSVKMTRLEVARFQLSIGSVAGAVATMGRGVSSAVRNLFSLRTALAGIGAIAAVKAVVDVGKSFEKTMAVVRGVTRATGKEFDDLNDIARKMGEQTRWSATQAAEGLRFLGMAGFEAAEAVKALPGVLDLATAGNLDLGRAADIATNALTAMGLSVDELGRVNDRFIATITRTNTDMEMMAESFKYAAPLAHAFGYDIETLSALIGLLGNAGIQGCYDPETEVLTKDGWKKWQDVTEDDEFATVHPETHEISYHTPVRLIAYRHTGKMYRVKNKHVDLLVTPNHNMFVSLYRTTDKRYQLVRADEVVGRPVKYLSKFHWNGNNQKYITLPGFSQNRGSWSKTIRPLKINARDFVEFLGWYLAEGCCDCYKRAYRICITQKNERGKRLIRSCLSRLPFKFNYTNGNFVIFSQQLYNYVVAFGKCYEKYIPSEIKNLSPDLLLVLYRTLVEGDGSRATGCVYSASKRLVDDIQEICLKIGYGAAVKDVTNDDKVGFIRGRAIKQRRSNYKVDVRKNQLTPAFCQDEYKGIHGKRLSGVGTTIKEEWVDYDGMVYCAEVPPDHVLIVRRNGKALACGNSMAGTQLAMAFQQTSRAAKELGLGPGTDLITVLKKIKEANWSAEKTMHVFTQRAGRAVLVLKEAIPEFESLREQIRASDGEAKQLAETMTKTVEGAFKALRSVIESVAIDMFERYREELKKSILGTTQWIRDHKTAIEDMASGAAKAAVDIGKLTTALGGLFGTITSGWGALPVSIREGGLIAAILLGSKFGFARVFGLVSLFSYTVGEFKVLGDALVYAEQGLVSYGKVLEVTIKEGSEGLRKLIDSLKGENPALEVLKLQREEILSQIDTIRERLYGGLFHFHGDEEQLIALNTQLALIDDKIEEISSSKVFASKEWKDAVEAAEDYDAALLGIYERHDWYDHEQRMLDAHKSMWRERETTDAENYLKALGAAKEYDDALITANELTLIDMAEYWQQYFDDILQRQRRTYASLTQYYKEYFSGLKEAQKEAEAYDEGLILGMTTDAELMIAEASVKEYQRKEDERKQIAEDTSHYLIELSRTTAESMQRNFSDFFFSAMKGEFDSLKDYALAIFDSILRAQADMMGQMLTQGLFGKDFKGGGWLSDIGSWLSASFGGGGGDYAAIFEAANSAGMEEMAAEWAAWSLFHKGGKVGYTATPKTILPVSPNTMRLHDGLAADEFPAILQKGEMVIPKEDTDSDKQPVTVNNVVYVTAMDAKSIYDVAVRNPEAFMAPFKMALCAGDSDLRSLIKRGIR